MYLKVVVVVDDDDDDDNNNNNNNKTIMFTDSINKQACVGLHIRVARKLIKLNRMILRLPVPFHVTKAYRGQQGYSSFHS